MALNKGKKFEARIKLDFQKIPNVSIDRIYDTQSGYKTISNISDFIVYKYPNIFYIEAKSHKGNTFPLSCLTQYPKLILKKDIPGVRAGVILWMIDHDKILYIPISTFQKLYRDKKKSFNINMIGDKNYKSIIIPAKKLISFFECDFTVLFDIDDKDIQ